MKLTDKAFSSPKELDYEYCRRVVFAIIALFLLIFSIYGNSFDCSWHFDDEPNITKNPNLHLKEITWENFKLAIYSDLNNPNIPYRPVACLSFALNYYFGELNVTGYHLVNIFIHLLSSIFLFLFIYHTLNLPSLKEKYSSLSYSIALLSATLWAINPIQTQAITYIVQRMASLAGMMYILAMYLYLKARTARIPGKKWLFIILCFVSFIMALSSKENAALLPLSILSYEILLIQRNPSLFLRKNLKGLLIASTVILLLGLTYLFLKGGNIFTFLDSYEIRSFTLGQRLLTESRIIIFYITLLLYPMPHRLNLAHSIEISTSLFNPISTLLSILVIAGAIVYTIYLAKKSPLISFCILFFFLNHLIESTIFPLELIFEHRNYIPSMLLFVPLAVGFCSLFNHYTAKKPMQYLLSGFIVLYLIGLGHSTFVRNFTWKNGESLWIDTIEKSPDLFRPYHNLGRYYDDNGFKQKAIVQYEQALTKPTSHRTDDKFVTYYNIGRLHFEGGDYRKAISYYLESIKLNPDFPDNYVNLAVIMDNTGDYDRTHEYLLKAIQLSPFLSEAHYNLGLFYLKDKQPDRAISHFQKAVKKNELNPGIQEKLGIAYRQKGEFGRAVTCFRKSLKENQRNTMVRFHLADVLFRTGSQDEARKEVEAIIRSLPYKEQFINTLKGLFPENRSRNITPTPHIIMHLIAKASHEMSRRLDDWGEYAQKRLDEIQEGSLENQGR